MRFEITELADGTYAVVVEGPDGTIEAGVSSRDGVRHTGPCAHDSDVPGHCACDPPEQ